MRPSRLQAVPTKATAQPPTPSSSQRKSGTLELRRALGGTRKAVARLNAELDAGTLLPHEYREAVDELRAALSDFGADRVARATSQVRAVKVVDDLLCIKLPPLDSQAGLLFARMGLGGVRRASRSTASPMKGPVRTVELHSTRSLFWVMPVSRSPKEFIRERQALRRALESGGKVPVLVQYFNGRAAELVFEPWGGSRSVVAEKPPSDRPTGRPRKLSDEALRASFKKNSKLSFAARARLLGVSRSTVHRGACRLGLREGKGSPGK